MCTLIGPQNRFAQSEADMNEGKTRLRSCKFHSSLSCTDSDVGLSFVSLHIARLRTLNLLIQYVEIKYQLDTTDDFYCRSYCLLNMFRAPLCPSSGARDYYTDGRCLWYLVLWFSSCRYGVEMRVMCPV